MNHVSIAADVPSTNELLETAGFHEQKIDVSKAADIPAPNRLIERAKVSKQKTHVCYRANIIAVHNSIVNINGWCHTIT
jgi:hypothetical protein